VVIVQRQQQFIRALARCLQQQLLQRMCVQTLAVRI
jgi:hypothetical protein